MFNSSSTRCSSPSNFSFLIMENCVHSFESTHSKKFLLGEFIRDFNVVVCLLCSCKYYAGNCKLLAEVNFTLIAFLTFYILLTLNWFLPMQKCFKCSIKALTSPCLTSNNNNNKIIKFVSNVKRDKAGLKKAFDISTPPS